MEISSKTPIKAKEVLDALNEKIKKKHTHTKAEITDFSEHTHTKEEINGFSEHTHTKEEINGFSDHTHDNDYYRQEEIKVKFNNIFNSLGVIEKQYYNVPDNCKEGDIVILDGIECLCIATDVTIQGSNLRRIAVDRRYNLGHYQKYIGMYNKIKDNDWSVFEFWKWGGHGTLLGTSKEVGYGLQNTINCLANPIVYTKGTDTSTNYDDHPWLWQGVNDFRASHSDNWFVPSYQELKTLVYRYTLIFDDPALGVGSYLTSSEGDANRVYVMSLNSGSQGASYKYVPRPVRLCRAF